MYLTLAILAGFVFAFSLGSRLIQRTPLSPAILGVGFGWALGPHGVGILQLEVDGELMQLLAELALALVLFSDASGADLRTLRRERALPLRLLLLGLPLTLALGTLLAHWTLPGLPWPEAALLATMLAPTDAALGAAVVSDRRVPGRIREGLNVESGLNDGICVPVLFVVLGLASGRAASVVAPRLMLEQLGIGAMAGLGLALAGSHLIHRSRAQHWLEGVWAWVILPSLALLCFASAQALGGSGFIAAFTGGIAYGAHADRYDRGVLHDTATGVGDTVSLVTWLVFGAAVVGPTVPHLGWDAVGYALLSLSVVRMLPVVLSLAGTHLDFPSKLFLGWFGPRGLASVVFVVIVLDGRPPAQDVLGRTVVAAVCLSVLLHGLSAAPLSAWMGRRG